ncbi:hypothetical protein OSL77_12215, partial [Escherichia coli]|nr:hypothetical protein [Escherichia coli]
ADRNRSHWSTSKTPSYTKSVSWQHHHVRRAFIGLYEEKQLSDNQDLHEKYFLDLMDIIDKGFGLLMKKKGIRIEPLENYFATKSINSFDSK